MMFIKLTLLSIVFFHFVTCDFISNKKFYFRSPLVLSKWPPIRQNGHRNAGLIVQLRPAGSNNIISRVPSPASFNSDLTLRSKFNNSPIKSSQKNNNKNGQLQSISSRPYAYAFKENQPKAKFNQITRPTKPVNSFVNVPLTEMKQNEYIYEKFNLQEFLKTIKSNESIEAIHTIDAPNLTIKYNENINKNMDSNEFEKLNLLDRKVHQYQVREQSHDSTNIDQLEGLKNNRNHQFSESSNFYQLDDIASGNNVKEFMSYNHDNKNIDAVTAPLVQLPVNQYFDLNLPQLQQYLLMQKSVLPLANSYNPTYLVMQSKNLLSEYQKHWDEQFKPENGYIDSSFTQGPGQNFQPFVHSKPKHAVTIAQMYSTVSPITFRESNIIQNNYQNVPSVIHSSPTASQLIDLNPNYSTHYGSDKNIDINKQPQHQIQIDAGIYHGHQLKNDLILKEAEQNLQKKLFQQQQRERSTLDLHQQAIVEQFKDSMKIVVSDQ